MANPEHLAKLKEGVRAWNEWRETGSHLQPDPREANLSRAKLTGVNLNGVSLDGADFSGADLGGANLGGANLSEAKLSGANLSGAGPGVASLIEGDLRRADLHGACLDGAYLIGAYLIGAYLIGANLIEVNLSGASLVDASLGSANLSQANLIQANLSGASLDKSNVSGADVAGTKFAGTVALGTMWCDIDLSGAVDLELISHLGPSSLDIDTLVQSKGRIPDAFLRGCGVPEHIIAIQKSLVENSSPIQFYSCFISYSHKDDEFCRRLHSRMQQEGLRVWFAPEEMKGGKRLHDQIDEAIRVYDKLLVVLSEGSMGSEWVVTEILKARKRERSDRRQVLFPIRLVDFEAIRAWERFDADTGKDVASEIREYFIPDFSNWKNHDSFEATFARLLKDLKASV